MPEDLIRLAPWAIGAVAFTVAMVKWARWSGGVDANLAHVRTDLSHLHGCVHRVEGRLNEVLAERRREEARNED